MSLLSFALLLLLAACGGSSGATEPLGDDATGAPSTREWRDLAYATSSSTQRLDLYLPPAGAGPFPVVVWVHGGGWQSGSKALATSAFQRRLLEHGIALASVGYRLSGEATWPAQIHDVKAAVRWLRANASRYHLRGERIGAWGSSAGGHLVAMLGTTGDVAALEGTALGNPTVSSRVQAVVDWYGPTEFLSMDAQALAVGCRTYGHSAPDSPESRLLGAPVTTIPDLVRQASPVTWVTADDPPFLIQHGSADCTVPYPQSELLRDALRARGAGAVTEYALLPGAGHGGPEFSSAANLALVAAFLARELSR